MNPNLKLFCESFSPFVSTTYQHYLLLRSSSSFPFSTKTWTESPALQKSFLATNLQPLPYLLLTKVNCTLSLKVRTCLKPCNHRCTHVSWTFTRQGTFFKKAHLFLLSPIDTEDLFDIKSRSTVEIWVWNWSSVNKMLQRGHISQSLYDHHHQTKNRWSFDFENVVVPHSDRIQQNVDKSLTFWHFSKMNHI